MARLQVRRRRALAALSRREREVLELFAAGRSGSDVAARLYLSPLTVRTHVRNARQKLSATTRTEAVAQAIRAELIS
jgi:two-component system nitrate/nitrite response regulator NarL